MTLLSVQGGICWRQAWSRNSGSCYSKVWADRRASCCIRGRGIPHRCPERHLDRNSTSSLPMSPDNPVRFERGMQNLKKYIYFTKVEGCISRNSIFLFRLQKYLKGVENRIINRSLYSRLSWRIGKPETASLQTRHSLPLPWKDYVDYYDCNVL